MYLPLIQCSECHTTGWLSRLAPASRKLSNRLDEIYNTFLIPQMFAEVAQGKSTPAEAVSAFSSKAQGIYRKWRNQGLV